MENSDTGSVSQSQAGHSSLNLRALINRIIAGNPFYLISAGLLLCGINQLTTDPKLVGAEFSMLRFNFCALAVYEIMLVATTIALTRRQIWYDALLLIGLSNLFVIVPFSLITRAVFLNSNLALAMSLGGTLLAVGKFWAFKRYIPDLRLPARLLLFGAALLLLNAAAPLKFKAIAESPSQIATWLNAIWLYGLPIFAGLANFLPRLSEKGDSPGQKRWLPLAFYLGWIVVTACHVGGIGYSLSFNWNIQLLVPLAWVASWTLFLRRNDFLCKPSNAVEQTLLFILLLVPLLAAGNQSLFPIFASLNLACYAMRFALKERGRIALIQLLSAVAILLGGLPVVWVDHAIPGISRAAWIAGCGVLCFFWLIFLSRDPRVALAAALGVLALCLCLAPGFARLAIQIGLVSILAHSLRWEDHVHRGAAILRFFAGALWIFLATSWLRESPHQARLPVYASASVLLIFYGVYALIYSDWKPWTVPIFAAVVLASEPGSRTAETLTDTSLGFLAIAASFLLFALGSFVAFSKSRNRSFNDKVAPSP